MGDQVKIPADRRERVRAICAGLRKAYPDAHCELDFSNPLQLLIATILSAQCTDVAVNKATPALFKKYQTARDFTAAPQEDLEQDIRSIGLYRAKARNIKACCRALVDNHGGQVPRTMAELHALAGVGRKTANVVLGNAFGINVGVVVDTHVARLSLRLGLTRHSDPVKIEKVLITLVPNEDWTIFPHWLIWHGRRRCTARTPDCPGCEIRDLCPSADRFGKACPRT